MKSRHSYFCIVTLVTALVASSCSPREESPPAEAKNKVKEAVKEIVTQDFKAYEGAKESLKDSQEKSKSELDAADKQMQQ
jgi:hypothetical protein